MKKTEGNLDLLLCLFGCFLFGGPDSVYVGHDHLFQKTSVMVVLNGQNKNEKG